MLKDLQNLINELQATNSSSEKKEILKKYPQCKELLKWTLDPYKKFGVTSDQLKKRKDLCFDQMIFKDEIDALIALLISLSAGVLSGHKAISSINWLTSTYPQYEDLIHRIIDKDLKCKTSVGLINKVYPGLIPEFKVALAEDYFKQKNVDLDSGKWLWSRKLDGVRCIARVENGDVKFYSREGHEFWTLDNLKALLLKLNLSNCVLDGEICITDDEGNENFQDVMKEIRKKDHTIKRPGYRVFDYLTLEEFDNQSSTLTLVERYERMPDKLQPNTVMLEIVPQTYIDPERPEDDIAKRLDDATDRGWEGLILRKDVPYEGKRTKNMLKVKKMQSLESEVKNVLVGLVDDGHGNKIDGMTAVEVEYKGNIVKVGSGWSLEERLEYRGRPELLIGRDILIQYFEETKNQDGKYSLRFPIKKFVYDKKREV